MFQIFLVLILFLQASNAAASEAPAEQWNRSFGGDDEDSSWCVEQTSDGGYIVAGITYSYGKGTKGYPDAWLIKVDNKGNLQWNKTFGGTYFDEGYFTRQTSDGGYVLSGYTFPSGYAEPWLIRTDRNGNEMWNKVSDEITHEDYLRYKAERTSDGGYIIGDTIVHEIGSYFASLLVDYDIRITKYDVNGNQQWNSTFGKNQSLETLDPNSVKQTSEGGYVIASTTRSKESNSYDIWLIKTDESGQEQWNKTFGGTKDDVGISISVTSDNGYVVTGRYNDSLSFVIDGSAFILKTDSDGNQEWLKEFSNCTLYSVQETSDGGYVAAGVKNDNAWLVKLEGDGRNAENEEPLIESDNMSEIESDNISESVFIHILNSIYGIFQRD
ncbi:hypothetical protein EO98_17395 [Methanosarcina sp. 2.H.T.1A.6]|nr:hypothetical protein EO94_01855 [Methanosarcina sp. 2.H.T.1A.3]KKG16313.1 hypothetical protein EO97_17165 [Methanosarcina sp. 2.H.T.1A.15]KKG22188.1 hypothetical protein EO96_07925 [Methanosarcina sp. 2.H.T.1A.8]KKG24530.1 hypothetical protein EO98_17395 [Methanosarcina sp. 2.H.T.1A.6]